MRSPFTRFRPPRSLVLCCLSRWLSYGPLDLLATKRFREAFLNPGLCYVGREIYFLAKAIAWLTANTVEQSYFHLAHPNMERASFG